MDIKQIINSRHSVRQYKDKPIEDDLREELNEYVDTLNKESGLNVQIIYDEPKCFDSFMAHYGKFDGVTNYIAIVGKKNKDLDIKAGYYGEMLVLKAQELGLNTCWVALTHGKSKAVVGKGEKQVIIISLGYGKHRGFSHKSKWIEDVIANPSEFPDWAKEGVEYALLAPTAMNQQKFIFEYKDNKVMIKNKGGMYSKVDLGIVASHFDLVTGKKAELIY